MKIVKNHWKILTAAVVGFIVLYSGLSYWAGIKAQESLESQYKLLTKSSLFVVKSHTYDRGWFSSTETTELSLNNKVVGPYLAMMPESLQNLSKGSIRYTNHITHGPFPGLGHFNFIPGRAWVVTKFDMSPSTQKTLSKFFGKNDPITITNHIGFSGGGKLDVSIPKFDYEEPLAGVHMSWQGLDMGIDYESNYDNYVLNTNLPGFSLSADTKGQFAFKDIVYTSDVRKSQTGVSLGGNELKIGNIMVKWNDAIPYNLKLNELIYLTTRIRVGEFVNPTGELRPSNVELKDLHYQIVTSEDKDFVNTRGKLDFASFRYNNDTYGPLKLDVSANHLHGPSLLKLDQALSNIPFEGNDPKVLRQRYIDTIMKYGVPLLKNDPELILHTLELKLPSGQTKADGEITIKGLQDSDIHSPLSFLNRFILSLNLELPKPALETLVVTQARNLFTVDASAEDQPDIAEIDSLAKSLLDAQLSEWQHRGLITIKGTQITTHLDFKDGNLQVNKKAIPLPWNEPEEDASAPIDEFEQ